MNTSVAVETPPKSKNGLPFHALVLAGAIFLFGIWELRSPLQAWAPALAAPNARLILYGRILLLQGAFIAFIWFALRHSGGGIRSLIDAAPLTFTRMLRLTGIGIAALLVWMIVSGVLGNWLRPSSADLRALMQMFPRTVPERIAWICFSLGAGVAEEIVYRGYLLQQLRRASGSIVVAVAVQAGVFASAHLALPLEMVIPIALLAVFLAVLALWRKSLVPGMVMHGLLGLAALMPLPA
jgi:membrane protease YdiL (CAAX protease family)